MLVFALLVASLAMMAHQLFLPLQVLNSGDIFLKQISLARGSYVDIGQTDLAGLFFSKTQGQIILLEFEIGLKVFAILPYLML
jgi:hypothetical protein